MTFSHLLVRLVTHKSFDKIFRKFILTESMDYFNKTTTKIEEIYKIMSSLNTNKPC